MVATMRSTAATRSPTATELPPVELPSVELSIPSAATRSQIIAGDDNDRAPLPPPTRLMTASRSQITGDDRAPAGEASDPLPPLPPLHFYRNSHQDFPSTDLPVLGAPRVSRKMSGELGVMPEKGEAGSWIMAFVRLRPMSKKEKEAGSRSCIFMLSEKNLLLNEFAKNTDHRMMMQLQGGDLCFDRVFPGDSSQQELYNTTYTCGRRSGHIPYRDSKLTRILQLSLGGNARTAIICTMSPALSHVEQSRNTLFFANCATEVTNNAQVNLVVSDKQLVKNLQKQVARLEEILRTPESSSSSCSEALLMEKELKIKKMEMEIEELKRESDLAKSQVDDLPKKVNLIALFRFRIRFNHLLAWSSVSLFLLQHHISATTFLGFTGAVIR